MMLTLNSNDHTIILFDGVCNFCNYWVNYVMEKDKYDKYRFATLQSDFGQELLKEYGLNTNEFESFILIEGGMLHQRSIAALMIAKNISGLFKILYPLIVVPGKLRDFIYNLIAKNRYKFFGKKDFCRVPAQEERSKFLTLILI